MRINRTTSKGNTPFIIRKIIPGIRKFLNGVPLSKSNDHSNLLPLGSLIRINPPYIAPNPRNMRRIIAIIFRVVFIILR
ncbi:unnamed protein product [marine sediment metagenome]|uniref:Uncharacterized protein n=1 Tax=marine sediment metagenome TaxID=412755 RepID=X1SHQ5_9ZZZZ